MNSWLTGHLDAIADALRRLFAAPLGALLSLLAIGIALSLPAGALVILENVQSLAGGLGARHEISLFMTTDAGRPEVAEIERRLRTGAVGEVRFVPKDEALKRLQATESLTDLLAGLPRNPLPDAFIVKPTRVNVDSLQALAQTMRGWPKVAHVQLDSAWVARLDALVNFGRLAVSILGAILAAGLLAVVFNTIRLQILGRRDEIELALLIGATPAFVARPFLWFGALEGLAGGALAVGLTAGTLGVIATPAAELVALYGGTLRPRLVDPALMAAIVATGTALGWAGAWISTRTIGRR